MSIELNIPDAKAHLADFVQNVAIGNMDAARAAYDQYINIRSSELVNEDHDKLLTEEGIDDFLKTLHKRAKKANKEKEFFEELSKFTKCDVKSAGEFDKCVDHFAEDKSRADKFIHKAEKALGLEKDDPAKDIKDTENDEK
jgi:nucleosome binding factor SPN SPT16 subunit